MLFDVFLHLVVDAETVEELFLVLCLVEEQLVQGVVVVGLGGCGVEGVQFDALLFQVGDLVVE